MLANLLRLVREKWLYKSVVTLLCTLLVALAIPVTSCAINGAKVEPNGIEQNTTAQETEATSQHVERVNAFMNSDLYPILFWVVIMSGGVGVMVVYLKIYCGDN